MGWIYVALDQDQLYAFSNKVMFVCVPQKARKFLTNFQKGLACMQLEESLTVEIRLLIIWNKYLFQIIKKRFCKVCCGSD